MSNPHSDTPLSHLSFTFSTQTVHTSPKDATPNIRLSTNDLHAIIAGDFTNQIASDARARIEFAISQNARIKQICEGFERGQDYQKDLKQLITPLKTNLPYILPSGFCSVHHDDKKLVYNGVVQLDIDIKRAGGAKEAQRIMLAIKSLSAAFPYILLAAISPTGYGIKIFVTTSNTNFAKHREAFEQVCNALCNALQIQRTDVDTLGVSQPCFLMSDPKAYFNPNCTAFVVKEVNTAAKVQREFVGEGGALQAEKAINYFISNRIDLGFEWQGFTAFSICLVNVFGEELGRKYANEVFSTSPKYNNDSKKQIRKLKVDVNRDIQNGIGTIIYHAKIHGFKPTYDTLPKVSTNTIQGEKGQYLTELLAEKGIDLTVENICRRKWIVPTGCGKSYLIAELAKKHKVVVVCPSTALVNQYGKAGASEFYEGHHDISDYDNFIAITYASLKFLPQYIKTGDYHLIKDECHVYSSNSYQKEMLRACAKQIEKYASFTQFTATDLPTFDKRLMQPTTIVKIPKEPKRLYVCHFKGDVLFNVSKLVKESVSRGRFAFVLLNDTGDKQKGLWHALGTDNEGVALLDAKKKDSLVFKNIIENEMILARILCMIATTVLKEGTNILNELELDFFVVGAFHHTEIEQAINRFRNAKNVACYICKGEESEEKPKPFNLYQTAYSYRQRAEKRVIERNIEKYENIELGILESENHVSKQINRLPIIMDAHGVYEVCDIELGCIVFEQERNYEYMCDAYQIENLAKYGFVYQQLGEIPTLSGLDTKEERSDFVQLCKTIEKERYEYAISMLSNVPDLTKELKKKVKDRTLTPPRKLAVSRVQYLVDTFDVDANTAIDALSKRENVKVGKVVKSVLSIESNSEFKKLCTRAHVQRCEQDNAWMESDRKKTILFKAIRAAFQDHKTDIYNSEQICSLLLNALKVDNTISIAALGNTESKVKSKLFEILNYFYEVTHVKIREGKVVTTLFRLSKCSTIFVCFSYKEEKTIQNDATLSDSKRTKTQKGKQTTFIDSFILNF